ncbi:MAG: phenylalanine--tRNA ligase beta subunit-related protein [Firmicutes bacterium]|nr:phenylalanine--tRNA ligase beta subunit-related protein [Bacillota bacterium]
MKFVVATDVFVTLDVCFGVVVARGINNQHDKQEIAQLLEASCQAIENRFAESKVKEAPEIAPYREAFTTLGVNPNKFPSSIEAMASRIAKKKGFPNINPVVDLGNAISLKYLLPLGAHDLDQATGTIAVRYANEGDRFVPFGQGEEELVPAGELIYSVGENVKTRRWIWRQSEYGKVTADSQNIFFPIDGFSNINQAAVLRARDELADLLQRNFACTICTGFLDQDHPEFSWS